MRKGYNVGEKEKVRLNERGHQGRGDSERLKQMI
jgi:hypothetical protein